jgi:ornithine decarboxylase
MKVKGVSFHVGSGGCSFNAYKESLENTKLMFELVDKMKMEPLSIIDIGGGFSMDAKNPAYNFDKIAP